MTSISVYFGFEKSEKAAEEWDPVSAVVTAWRLDEVCAHTANGQSHKKGRFRRGRLKKLMKSMLSS